MKRDAYPVCQQGKLKKPNGDEETVWFLQKRNLRKRFTEEPVKMLKKEITCGNALVFYDCPIT